jgi:maltooligosyltrehalose trehalohydrolase
MRPDVWAPAATTVDVVLGDGRVLALEPETTTGWWHGGPTLEIGDRYGFAIDGGAPLPDPRSRWQPEGVHRLSAVDDPSAHGWTDGDWGGVDLLGGVIYELHIGTFTEAGTFDAAIERLDDLVDLGVVAVEVMPVAEAMGERGWGYDGVDLWAAHHRYGGPAAMRRFVDAAHVRGLGVLLDVVYNHLGPEGNYLARFGPYFTERHHTPWGAAVNLDGPGSPEVRRFIVENALHWCRDHHIDGLRIDATHQLIDESPTHVVAELSAALDELSEESGVRRWVIVEREQPEHFPMLPAADGGWGVDARWADDLHHALHAYLTGEADSYYEPFGRLEDIAAVLKAGHLAPGEALPMSVAPSQLITCSQNHDQVGNRAGGERLAHLTDVRRASAAAAVVLLGPGTPLIFQGEEWAASSPFPFFCDPTDPDLAEIIRSGRRNEFEAFGWAADAVADPIDPATASSAVLRWEERIALGHREVLAWYRSLIALRRSEPELAVGADRWTETDHDHGTLILHRGLFSVAVNLSPSVVSLSLAFEEIIATNGEVTVVHDGVELGPWSVAVTRGAKREHVTRPVQREEPPTALRQSMQ